MFEKKLALINPPVRGDSDYAYQLSVILNNPKSIQWIYCNYIQLYFNDDDPVNPIRFFYMDLSNRHDRLWDTKNPFLDYQIVHKDTLKAFNIDIVEFIIEMLKLDNYVYLYLNEEKMSTRAHIGSLRLHVNMFYGFDCEKRIFYIVGYNANGFYSQDEISFDEVEKAFEKEYRHFYNDKNMMYIFKLNTNEIEYNLDITAIITQLKEFLNSSDPTRRFAEYVNSNKDLTFGLDVYRKYILYLHNECENQYKPNIKPMYNLWEHKKLMNERLKYLVSENLLRENNQGIGKYKELQKNFKIMVNLLIKSAVKKNYSDYDKVISILENSIQKERSAIEALLDELYRYRK